MCRVCECYRGGIPHNDDGCVLAWTLYKYDLRMGDLFVLSWARVRQVRWGSISSVLIMCGGGLRSILLLPLLARCHMVHVCFYVCCSDCVGVCGNVCCVVAVVKDSGFLSLGVYVCVRGVRMLCFLFVL